jgi:hypothetical protein
MGAAIISAFREEGIVKYLIPELFIFLRNSARNNESSTMI